jgi:hypothetical protein
MKFTSSFTITWSFILFSLNLTAQVKDFNRLSIDGSIGVNKMIINRSPGVDYPYFGLVHGDLGVRYMANSKFGVKLDGGIDQIKTKSASVENNSQLIRVSLQAIVNIGRICNFEDFNKKFSILGHAGPSIGFNKDVSKTNKIAGTDRIGQLIIGVAPMFKLNKKMAITADLSVIGAFSQQRSFDFKTAKSSPGFDSYYGTATVGLTYYVGKKNEHIDWKLEDNDALKKRMDELEAELENTKGDVDLLNQDLKAIEAKMMDDDNDGVANYLDIEPNTPEGAIVNTKGQEVKAPKFDDLMNNDPNQGLFYTVQLGVFSNMIPEKYWKNISPMYKMKIEDGTTRYYSGIFHSVDEAKEKLDQSRQNGLTDAFITSYYRGKRITVAEADLIFSTRGASALRPKP